MDLILKIVIANSIVSLLYMIFALIRYKDRAKTILLTIFFLLCPIVGMAGFLIFYILYNLRRNKNIEISGIYFSDEKISYQRQENYLEEIDIAPIEEILSISSVKEKRQRLLDSIKSDIAANMATYSGAVLSDDSEVSHYAAAMLSKTKDTFDRSLNRLAQSYDEDRTDAEVNLAYIKAEDDYLQSGIRLFTEERLKHLHSYVMLCENLYKHNPQCMTTEHFSTMINYLIELNEHSRARNWIDIFADTFPQSEDVYISRLKFYFVNNERASFFDTLDSLKASGIPISSQTIDLIRFFSMQLTAK